MAVNKKGIFINEKVHKFKVDDLEGSITVPIVITDDQAGIYYEKQIEYNDLKNARKKAESEGAEVERETSNPYAVRFDWGKHLVLAAEFPGLTIENFRNGERPWHQVILFTNEVVSSLIDDAFEVPNS